MDTPPPLLYKTMDKCTGFVPSGRSHPTSRTANHFLDRRSVPARVAPEAATPTAAKEPTTGAPFVRRRRAYTREEKLDAVAFYRKCGKNKYKTCKEWKIDSRTLSRWIKDETKIRQLRPGKMAARFRTAKYPLMEEELHQQYCNMLDIGKKVDTLWLREKAQEIMRERSPQADFKFSACWLRAFKRRYGISFREKKECAQVFPLPMMIYYWSVQACLAPVYSMCGLGIGVSCVDGRSWMCAGLLHDIKRSAWRTNARHTKLRPPVVVHLAGDEL